MASKQQDRNCINCDDRHEKSTHPDCVECLKKSKAADQFPDWKPIVEPDH